MVTNVLTRGGACIRSAGVHQGGLEHAKIFVDDTRSIAIHGSGQPYSARRYHFQSSGIVTAIDGITIAGTTYNVTFGMTDDTTFAGSATALTAIDALSVDLTPFAAVMNQNFTKALTTLIGVDGGSGTIYTAGVEVAPLLFFFTSTMAQTSFSNFVGSGLAGYAEFTPRATPEPDTFTLALTGIGLLGLLAVIRKRVALRHTQAT